LTTCWPLGNLVRRCDLSRDWSINCSGQFTGRTAIIDEKLGHLIQK
jgi:hypothetical protein